MNVLPSLAAGIIPFKTVAFTAVSPQAGSNPTIRSFPYSTAGITARTRFTLIFVAASPKIRAPQNHSELVRGPQP